jgi:hypothetical protein
VRLVLEAGRVENEHRVGARVEGDDRGKVARAGLPERPAVVRGEDRGQRVRVGVAVAVVAVLVRAPRPGIHGRDGRRAGADRPAEPAGLVQHGAEGAHVRVVKVVGPGAIVDVAIVGVAIVVRGAHPHDGRRRPVAPRETRHFADRRTVAPDVLERLAAVEQVLLEPPPGALPHAPGVDFFFFFF